MRNRNSRLSLAVLLALAMTAGACSCGDTGAGDVGPEASIGKVAADPEERAQYLVDFGAVAINATESRTVEIRNVGSAQMNVDRIDLSAPFGSDVPAEGFTLAVGASRNLTFTYTPTTQEESGDEAIATVSYNGGKITFRLTGRGIVPSFSCVPATVDFGKVERGQTETSSVTCTNNTELEAKLTAGPMSGDNPKQFEYTLAADAVIRPRGSQTIPVVFKADGNDGKRNANFTLYTDGVEVQRVELAAEVVRSTLELPRGCLDFGYIPPGAKVEKKLVVRNLGSKALIIQELNLVAGNAYRVKTPTPITINKDDPSTEVKENEAEIIIEFAPQAIGDDKGMLQIVNTSTGDPMATQALCGYGGGPLLTCSPSSIDFGTVAVGLARTREYICTNSGEDVAGVEDDNLFVSDVISGLDEFTAIIVNGDGSTGPKSTGYAAGDFFEVQVTYAPTRTSFDTTDITILSNDGLNPEHKTRVSGDGLELPPCDFTILPPQLTWGIVTPGRKAEQQFAVRNNENHECLISDVRVQNDNGDVFSIDPVETVTLPGGGEVRFTVAFTAPASASGSTAQIFTGKVLFEISNPDNRFQEVPLRAASMTPCAEIVPEHLDFGTAQPGGCSTRDRELRIVNVCDFPIIIESIEMNAGPACLDPEGNDPNSVCEFVIRRRPPLPTPNPGLMPGDSATFDMAYKPADVGDDIGSVLITVRDTPEPYMATLQGRGSHDALHTDVFSQAERPKVDLLWVIDNSCSMSEEQTLIGQNLSSFLAFAVAEQIDFQLGVTSTDTGLSDTDPTMTGGRLVPVDGSRSRILTPWSSRLEHDWAANVALGTGGSATEKGLLAAKMALSPGLIDVADHPGTSTPNDGNLGFLRPDAALSIIFVSDEADHDSTPTDDYLQFFRSIKGARNDNLFKAHGIISDPVVGCPTDGRDGTGVRYEEIINRTGGVWESICATDWQETLEVIGNNAFGFSSRFFLSNIPVPGDNGEYNDLGTNPGIIIEINGIRAPSKVGRTTVWSYHPGANAIDFNPFYVPEAGSQVEITYRVACL